MTVSLLTQILVLGLVVTAVVVALLRDILAATVVFGAYSLGMAILWVGLQAPDVALTEAAVGAGVTTSLFIVAILKTGRPLGGMTRVRDVRPVPLLGVVALGGVLLVTVPSLPAVGSPDTPPFEYLAPRYLEQALPTFGTENVVTAILAGFRSFDTFGEVTVVVLAGVALLVVFQREVI